MSHRDIVPAFDLDSNRTISAVGKRIGWVIADNVDVAKLVSNLASQARHILDGLSIVDGATSGFGYIGQEIPPVRAIAA
jgi:hypothetical protein